MLRHGGMMWMCGLMVAAALIVLAVSGNAGALLPAIGCMLMMVMMMSMMASHGGGSGKAR